MLVASSKKSPFLNDISQLIFTFSKSAMETQEKGVKYCQS